MKYIKYTLVFVILFLVLKCLNSANTGVSKIQNTPINNDNSYVVVTLQDAKISEWRVSTEENKLVTCEDFIIKINRNQSLSEIKNKAFELKSCINEATSGSSVSENEKVVEIASLCSILLKY